MRATTGAAKVQQPKPPRFSSLRSSRAIAVVAAAAVCWAGFQLTKKPAASPATAAGTHDMGAAPSHASGGLASAINAFGGNLFDEVASKAAPGPEPAGLFLSPYGIAQALAMVLNGVEPDGESYRQLQSVVYGGEGNSLSLEALNTQLQSLSTALVKPPSDDLTVSDANSAWLAQKYQLQPGYSETLKAVFGSEARPLTTADAVNSWVSEATRGKITSIVDSSAVQQAVLVLVNAIYFKGLWLHQFKKTATHAMDFYPLQHSAPASQAAAMFQVYKGKTAVQVAKLSAKAGGATVECGAVQLPYRGDEFYAVAALPLGQLSAEPAEGGQRGLVAAGGATVPYSAALKACRHALLESLPAGEGASGGGGWSTPKADVKVYLPRFEIEFSTSLGQPLQALGIKRPFLGGDITQIAADAAGHAVDDLMVSEVLHKVYAKVDEAGTEAAAATAVLVMQCSMPIEDPEEIELRFDRPFVFAVVHKPSGLALVTGEVYQPEKWSGQA